MQNRQEHQATVKSVSFISKFLFSLTCIVSFISIVLLMSQRERANKALSGEVDDLDNDSCSILHCIVCVSDVYLCR